jgi:hypothetical protein
VPSQITGPSLRAFAVPTCKRIFWSAEVFYALHLAAEVLRKKRETLLEKQ